MITTGNNRLNKLTKKKALQHCEEDEEEYDDEK